MEKKWKIWDKENSYGDTFFERSTGKLPEMESSKAVAKIVSNLVTNGDKIVDVGCGGGHYLVSLDNKLACDFHYLGVDATDYYIQKGIDAFCNNNEQENPLRKSVDFKVGDIFNLPLESNLGDIVMCNNVLLHLPSIEKPLSELIRVSKKYIIVRTLIGHSAFRIKHIKEPEIYNADGDPENFYFFNIYSENYVKRLLDSNPDVKSYKLFQDNDFDANKIGHGEYKEKGKEVPYNVTTVVNGMQINNYIIQPWQFLIIEKK